MVNANVSAVMAAIMLDQRLVVLASVIAAFGLVLIVGGFLGVIPLPGEATSGVNELAIRTGLAATGGLLMYALSGWIVFSFFMMLAGWFAVTLKNAKRERVIAIERVDAIASWVEGLRDSISGSAGLQQALKLSAEHASAPIRKEVRELVHRLQHEPVQTALRRFAADVAHPTSDMAVACLILATNRSAGSLASVLAQTAQAARDSATMQRQVEAGRASTQSQAKLVGIVTGGITLGVTVLTNYTEPFDTAVGQIVQFCALTVYFGAAYALYRLARPKPPERAFKGVENGVPLAAPPVAVQGAPS